MLSQWRKVYVCEQALLLVYIQQWSWHSFSRQLTQCQMEDPSYFPQKYSGAAAARQFIFFLSIQQGNECKDEEKREKRNNGFFSSFPL